MQSRGSDGIMYTLHEWTVYFMQYTNEQWAEYCAWRSRWSTSEWLRYFNGIHVPACIWTLWYLGYPDRASRLLELMRMIQEGSCKRSPAGCRDPKPDQDPRPDPGPGSGPVAPEECPVQ